MKKKIIAIALVGIMTLSNFVPAFASRNSASISGSTAGFNATGTITIDNVTNESIATATASVACGMNVTAIFVYNNGETHPAYASNYTTSCTAVAQKSGVQAKKGIGIFKVVRDPYSWSQTKDVNVI